MNINLLALKLVLDGLGVGTSINDVNERKEKQKAVYLAKICGADLGYSYGWYVRGPYSPSLTKDYYELQNAELQAGAMLREDINRGVELAKRNYIENPLKPNDLENHNWLELLASWHYLRTVSEYDFIQSQTMITQKKPHLTNHVNIAEQVLGLS